MCLQQVACPKGGWDKPGTTLGQQAETKASRERAKTGLVENENFKNRDTPHFIRSEKLTSARPFPPALGRTTGVYADHGDRSRGGAHQCTKVTADAFLFDHARITVTI